MERRREQQLFRLDGERPPEDYKKIVLALLQQCKDAGLTVAQANAALGSAASLLNQVTAEQRVKDIPFDV